MATESKQESTERLVAVKLSCQKFLIGTVAILTNTSKNGLGNFIKTFGGTVAEEFVKDFGTIRSVDIAYFDYNWKLNSA